MVGYVLDVALCRFPTLHVCLGVDLGGFRHCMWVDSGELCYSRPSELASPRREYQNAHPGSASSTRPGEGLHFWATGQLAQARQRRLSEKSWNLPGPNVVDSPKREPVAWARQLLSPGRLLLAWARLLQRVVPILFSLCVWWVNFVIYLFTPFFQNLKNVNMFMWLFESCELKICMLAWITHGFCLVGWLRTWMRIGCFEKKVVDMVWNINLGW